jgi:cell wall-associated NlpC family hydrolase
MLSAGPAFAAQRFGSRELSPGMRGADVRTLQQDLTVVGFRTRITGVFNQPTEHNVIAFQRRYRLGADGVVGPITAGKLDELAAARAKTAEEPGAGAAGLNRGAASSANSAGGTSSTQAPTTTTDPTPTTTTPQSDPTGPSSGGASYAPGPPNAPVEKAHLNSDGLAVAPADAPAVIREIIAAANQIAFDPYVYGGGHQSFQSNGYDCSGSVSYALHGGGLLSSPYDSTQFETYGTAGHGRWITIWANGGHAYMNVAGLWFDTAAQSSSNGNDRWSATRISGSSGFIVRHPTGW